MTSHQIAPAKTSHATQSKALPAQMPATQKHPMLHLQRQVGNQAATSIIQAKLTVGEPNDAYEQEADRVSAEVVRKIYAPTPPTAQRKAQTTPKIQPLVQRKGDTGGMTVSDNVEADIQQARGSGQPLPENLRTSMEQAFGADFSGVRVHTDGESDRLNQSIQAKAFTTGQNIFFSQGAYDPGSLGGQELLAHELTHVVQQTSNDQGTLLLQRAINKTILAQQIKSIDSLSEMGSYLTTFVRIRNSRTGQFDRRKISQIGLARIVYINENQDEGDTPDDKALTDPLITYLYERPKADASPKADVIAEIECVLETLSGRARSSDGGGLLHSTSDKQWAYQDPHPDTPTQLATEEAWKNQKFWQSPIAIDKPGSGFPPPDIVHTPGGSDMNRVTSYHFQTPGGTSHYTHTYATGVPPREPNLDSTATPTGTPKLTKYSTNFKRVQSAKINEKLLDEWASKRQGWKPDQNTAMKNTSAKEAAAASGYPTDRDWQWLHLIAFTLGGEGGKKQPNDIDNLVAGLAAANGHHLVLENLVKKMILSGYVKEIEIVANAHMSTGKFHIAERIDYMLKWQDPATGIDTFDEFKINTLDPNRSMGGHLSILANQLMVNTSLGYKKITDDYLAAINNFREDKPGTKPTEVTAYESYVEGTLAMQNGQPARFSSQAAKAAEAHYQATLDALKLGHSLDSVTVDKKPVSQSFAAQTAAKDYKAALDAIKLGHSVGPSFAAQSAANDYKAALGAIKLSKPIGSSWAAKEAKADYDSAIGAAKSNNDMAKKWLTLWGFS